MGMIFGAIFCFSLQLTGWKLFSKTYIHHLQDRLMFNGLICLVTSLYFFIMCDTCIGYPAEMVMLSIEFGAMYAIVLFSYVMAMQEGSMAYSTLALQASLIIPVAAGTLFWHENFGLLQMIGLALLFITFFIGAKAERNSKISFRWILFCAIAFLSNGFLSLTMKRIQVVSEGGNIEAFMALGFLFAAILSFAAVFIYANKAKLQYSFRPSIKPLGIILFSSLSTAIANKLSMAAMQTAPVSVVIPVISGGVLAFTSIVSLVIFQEKLQKRQQLGLAIGFISVIMMALSL